MAWVSGNDATIMSGGSNTIVCGLDAYAATPKTTDE
jgi:hypothetical protein